MFINYVKSYLYRYYGVNILHAMNSRQRALASPEVDRINFRPRDVIVLNPSRTRSSSILSSSDIKEWIRRQDPTEARTKEEDRLRRTREGQNEQLPEPPFRRRRRTAAARLGETGWSGHRVAVLRRPQQQDDILAGSAPEKNGICTYYSPYLNFGGV